MIRIAFLTKINKPGVAQAIKFLNNYDVKIDIYKGEIGSEIPKELFKKKYDILISYINPWVLTQNILVRTKKYNINFHPGPPEYPGIGCFNFALYNEENFFGATAHFMNAKVDTGEIILSKKFDVNKKDNIDSISIKTYNLLLNIFKETIGYYFENNRLKSNGEKWKRKPYTRKDLNLLTKLSLKLNKKEFKKRIRASCYSKYPKPTIKIHGYLFRYENNK